MERDRFNALLADLDQITDADIKSLNQLRKEYPYFQNQYVMMAKALKDREHPKVDAFVKKAALFVADQSLLKGIINGTHDFVTAAVAEAQAPEPPVKQPEVADSEQEKAQASNPEQPAEASLKAEEKPEVIDEKPVAEVEGIATKDQKSEPTPAPEEKEETIAEVSTKTEHETVAKAAAHAVEGAPTKASKPEEAPAKEAKPAEIVTAETPEEVKSELAKENEAMLSELEKDLKEIKEKKRLLAKMLEQSEDKERQKTASGQKKTLRKGKKNQSELIEKFIRDEPQMDKQRLVSDENPPEQADLASKHIKGTDQFHTETLANLMVKQKKYKKAIDIYEKLGLKFPEKRAYFASQIEKVKNKSNV